MDKCCTDVVKFLLFLATFAAWLAFGFLLGGALYTLVRSDDVLGFHVQADFSPENPTAIYFTLIVICVVVAAFLFLSTFLGCCGAACNNACMLGSFIIIVLALLGANAAAIAYVYTHFSSETDMVGAQMKATIPYYDAADQESVVRRGWDALQTGLSCCGVTDWSDWAPAKLKTGRKVPASCCLPERESDCVYQPDAGSAHPAGCLRPLELPVRAVFWGLPAILLVVLLSSICVCKGARSRGRHRHDSDDDDVCAGSRSARRKSGGHGGGSREHRYSEDSGYVYRASAPPYGAADNYPMGVVAPPHHDPMTPLLLQQPRPPPYHDVVAKRY